MHISRLVLPKGSPASALMHNDETTAPQRWMGRVTLLDRGGMGTMRRRRDSGMNIDWFGIDICNMHRKRLSVHMEKLHLDCMHLFFSYEKKKKQKKQNQNKNKRHTRQEKHKRQKREASSSYPSSSLHPRGYTALFS